MSSRRRGGAASSSASSSNEADKVKHVSKNELPDWMLKERTRVLNNVKFTDKEEKLSSVVYWMHRDVRTVDNWALLFASYLAKERNMPLRVMYTLPSPPKVKDDDGSSDNNEPPALIDMPLPERHGMFLLAGLKKVHKELQKLHIPLHVVMPKGGQENVGRSICETVIDPFDVGLVVCDFTPLRHVRNWQEHQLASQLESRDVPFYQVDAHNVVPVWFASPKREVGARTLRPKIHKLVNDFCQEYPEFKDGNTLLENKDTIQLNDFELDTYIDYMKMDDTVPVVDGIRPGTKSGMLQFDYFVKNGLKKYDTLRNNPNNANICSNMSIWLNHGHVSFQRLLIEVKKLNKYASGVASFVEEGLVRRELSDNFCYYSPNYDSLSTAAGWAQETLETHAPDDREYVYSLEQLEKGQTHDDLWNAAQLQVVREGGMHGFLRMYWAKKILEWTGSPRSALHIAQYFNDKYALDGRDPNGFVGVGWSIMGIHDQGWKERPIFGKIRFMNYAGCKRKFDVNAFVKKYPGALKNAQQSNMKTQIKIKVDQRKKRNGEQGNSSSNKTKKLKKGTN